MRRRPVVLMTLLILIGSAWSFAAEGKNAPKKTERSAAAKAAIAKIRQMGGHVLEIAQNDPHLVVAFHLADGKVTDAHLEPLKDLADEIVQLNLRGTDITDDGLKHIAGLKALRKLHLEKTRIGDKGLAHLKGLQNLEYLNVYGTQVTDAGLKQLTGLKKLKRLYIWQSKVTINGVAQMKKAMPGLKIIPDLVAEKAREEARKKAEAKKKPKKKKSAKKNKKMPKKPAAKKPAEKKQTKKKQKKQNG